MNPRSFARTFALLAATTAPLTAQIDFLPVNGVTGPNAPRLADVIDFDGNYTRDILATRPGELWVYSNASSARLNPPGRIPVPFPSGNIDVRAYWLDLDTEVDLVAHQIGGSELRVFLQGAGRTFQTTFAHSSAQPIEHVVVGEVSGDQALDLVVQTSTTVEIFANQGGGGFQSIALFPHAGLDQIFLADVGDDGDLDVLASGSSAAQLFFLENQGGTLAANSSLTIPASHVLTMVFDLDRNGHPDLVLVSDPPVAGQRTLRIVYGSVTGPRLVTLATVPATEVGSFLVSDFQFATELDLSWFTGSKWYVVEGRQLGPSLVYEVPSNPRWPWFVQEQRWFAYDEDLDGDLVVGTPQGFIILENQYLADVVRCPFNETRGPTTGNLGARAWADANLSVSVPDWQADAGRRDYRGNDRGYGCLGAPHGGVVTGRLRQDFSFPYLTLGWWQRFPAGPPAQERTVFELEGFVRVLTGGPHGRELVARTPLGNASTTSGLFQPGAWHHVVLEVFGLSPTTDLTWRIDGSIVAGTANLPGALSEPRAGVRFGIGGDFQGQDAVTTHLDLDDFRVHNDFLALPAQQRMMASEGFYVLDLGGACRGTFGDNALQVRGVPRPGNLLEFALENVSIPSAYVILLGASTVQWSGVPLPLPLGNGCSLGLSPDLLLTGFQPRVLLPHLPVMNRGHVYAQALVAGAFLSASAVFDVTVEY